MRQLGAGTLALRLQNKTEQRPCADGTVEGNRYRDRRSLFSLLHNAVAAALAYCQEALHFENLADLEARQNTKLSQQGPQPGSPAPRRDSAASPRTDLQFQKKE